MFYVTLRRYDIYCNSQWEEMYNDKLLLKRDNIQCVT